MDWASDAEYYRDGFELFQQSITECMSNRGFEYRPTLWYDDDIVATVMNPLNRAAAKEYGYHIPPYGAQDVSHQVDNSPEFSRALLGDSTIAGCHDVAYEFAYGGSAEQAAVAFDSIVAAVSSATSGYAQSDDGLALTTLWAECMSNQGYAYDTPADPSAQFSGEPEVTEEEVRVRLADLTCDEEVGLTESRSHYEVACFTEWVDQNALAVREMENALEAAHTQIIQRLTLLRESGVAALNEG